MRCLHALPVTLAMLLPGCGADPNAAGEAGATSTGNGSETGAATQTFTNTGGTTSGTTTEVTSVSTPDDESSTGALTRGTSTTAGDTGTSTSSDTTGDDTPPEVTVYVTDGDRSIHAFLADPESGALTALGNYAIGRGAAQVIVDPASSRAYATASPPEGPRLLSFELRADGSLVERDRATIPLGSTYLTHDGPGDHVLVAHFGGDAIAALPVARSGLITSAPSSQHTVGDEPHANVLNASRTRAYVPHRGDNAIWIFDYQSGVLTPHVPPRVAAPDGAGARHIVLSAAATHAYVTDEYSDTVSHYTLDGAGTPTWVSATPTLATGANDDNNTTADLHLSPDEAHLYVSNRGDDSIAHFTLDAQTGEPTLVSQTATEARPRGFHIDPLGRYLWVAGQDSGFVVTHPIDSAGELQTGPRLSVGHRPAWVRAVALP